MKYLYSNEIKKCLPILQAMAEGKTVQYLREQYKWEDLDPEDDGLNIETLINHPEYYRIKPTPTYRPFANAEECWEEMLKHQPFGWVKDKSDGHYSVIMRVDDDLVINVDDFGMKCVFEHFSFADGSAFGVKVEEK